MLEIINRWIKGPQGSKDEAKSRLKFLLVHDQVDLSPGELDQMKAEIIEVISRYVNVDQSSAQIRLEKEEGNIALVSNVPVSRVIARAV